MAEKDCKYPEEQTCQFSEAAVDVKWMKRLGTLTFTGVVAILCLVLLSIYNTGYQVRGIEQNSKDLADNKVVNRQQDREISELKQNQRIFERSLHSLEEEVKFGRKTAAARSQ